MAESSYRVSDLPPRLVKWIRVDLFTGCWLWVGHRNRSGYGRVNWRGRTGSMHSLAYRLLIGPVPAGLELDHVRARGCIWRNCCNPAHLEAVTHAENLRRRVGGCASGVTLTAINAVRTQQRWLLRSDQPRHRDQMHCPQGHELVPGNLVKRSNGKRECARCNADRVTAIYRRDMADPAKATLLRAAAAKRGRKYRERKGDPTGKLAMRQWREQKRGGPVVPQSRCSRGHEFTEENTILNQGRRRCRTCHRDRERARYQARRSA